MADTYTAKAVEFIQRSKDKPFFLFFATHDIHVPRMPHERFLGRSPLGCRGDVIEQMDWCVGQLLETLDRLELTNKTLVLFCSDNGPVVDDGYQDGAAEKLGDHKPAGPFRGGKYSVYEGGTRTPLIARWPGRIPAGVSDEIICLVDLPASMAALVGQGIPANACPDSCNVLPALLGQPGAKGRDHLVQQGAGLALREGEWKLVKHPNAKAVKSLTFEKGPVEFELFNLAQDPGETQNVIEDQPQRAEELKTRLEAIRQAGR
jgi:arylsulfatase A